MKKAQQVKTLVYACSSIALSLYLSSSFANTTTKIKASAEDTQKMVNFLANSDGYITQPDANGNWYMGSAKDMWYPLSYVSKTDFWYKNVCQGQCAVTDQEYYNAGDYHLWPSDPTSVAGSLQFERIDAVTGSNIYDAAVSQIALALGANQPGADVATLLKKANSVTTRVASVLPNNNKAVSPAFHYGDLHDDAFGGNIRNPKLAFDYRMVGQHFLTQDPLMTVDPNLITTNLLDHSGAKHGDVSWVDWKPITGENAWGNLIGPVQTAYLDAKANGKAFVDFRNPGIQNAIYSLFAFQRMQSPMGAIYYAPKGTYGNAGTAPVPDGSISTENNASTLAGLRMLETVLRTTKANQTDLTTAEQGQLNRTLNLIDIMIYGGAGPAGTKTEGILNYFKNYAWSGEFFYQGGVYKNGTFTPNDLAHGDPNAVDVNTWGLAAVGPKFLDETFQHGASFKMLSDVFVWGGFTKDDKLIGVGFSSADNHSIMSGEWTAGAINALRVAIEYYQNEGKGYITKKQLGLLQTWEAQMTEGLTLLRNDTYPQANFPDAAVGFPELPADQIGLVYATKRYYIPFGWYANPVLSTASTGWAVMLNVNYNPFALNGSYADYRTFSDSANYDKTDPSGAWTPAQPIHVIIKNGVPDQTINVGLEKAPNKWEAVGTPIPVGGQLAIDIPVDTFALGINAGPNHYGACTLTQDELDMLQPGSMITGSFKPNQTSCDIAVAQTVKAVKRK